MKKWANCGSSQHWCHTVPTIIDHLTRIDLLLSVRIAMWSMSVVLTEWEIRMIRRINENHVIMSICKMTYIHN